MTGKGVVRSIKNYAKGFSDVQRKVREATSNDPWGPSGTLMNEVAQLTFNQHDFIEIMDMIDKRLNDKGKNWRHVFKALLLLDYCLHVGSENVVLYAKENVYVIKTLKEFQHVDDNGRDVGANVRQKAKDITSLLTDDARLKDERRQRQQMRDRMAGVNDYMNDAMGIRPGDRPVDPSGGGPSNGGGRQGDGEDRELQRALDESRRMAEAEERKRLEKQGDEDLAKAIRLSEQEAQEKERKQKEKIERENQDNMFSLNNTNNNNAQAASFNPFPQTQSFDSSLNPYQQQQQQLQQPQQQWPQATGMTNMTFGDPIGAGNPQLTVQNTGMMNNPYQQQQQQLQLQNNPYQQMSGAAFGGGLQAQMTGLPQQNQMTGMAPFQTSTVTGFQQPQFTAASNNPFGQLSAPQTSQTSSGAFGSGTFGQTLSASPTVTSATLANRSPSLSVANTVATSSAAGQSRSLSFPTSPSMQPTGTQATSSPSGDGRFAKLNALLANKDDGMDTFGNTGNLRFPMGTGYANTIQPDFTGATNTNNNSGSNGDILNIGDNGNGTQQNTSNTQSSFADAFSQQTSRNPFGQPSPSLAPATPKTNNQKSLLELMQEQKQQQQQQSSLHLPQTGMQPQMTGMQPQMTGMQPQMTGMQPQMTGMPFGQQQQQQQQQQQSSPFLQQPQITGFNNGFGQQNHQTGSLF